MPSNQQPLTTLAYAKINLGLSIGPQRSDGYHELQTIFAKIDLADTLEISPRPDQRLTLQTLGAQIPRPQNLVYRAAQLLQKLTPKGAHIILRKKIPGGAGLGGGSADAAGTLKTLAKIWQLPLSKTTLSALALQLGSDVPQALTRKICQATGRGEILQPFKLPRKFPKIVVLVIPPIKISTTWAFRQLSSPKRLRKTNFQFPLRNDFEPLIFQHYPAIQHLKIHLQKLGAVSASLSGSGASVFGLFTSKANAQKAAAALTPHGQVFLTRIFAPA